MSVNPALRFLDDEYQTFKASVTFTSISFLPLTVKDCVNSKLPTPVYPPEPVNQTPPPALSLPEYEPVVKVANPLIASGILNSI